MRCFLIIPSFQFSLFFSLFLCLLWLMLSHSCLQSEDSNCIQGLFQTVKVKDHLLFALDSFCANETSPDEYDFFFHDPIIFRHDK